MSIEASRVKVKPIDVLRKVANNRLAIGLTGFGLLAGTVFGHVETNKLMPTIPVPIREGIERYDKFKIQVAELINNNEPTKAAEVLLSDQFLSAEEDFQAVRSINLNDRNLAKRALLATMTVVCFFGAGFSFAVLLHKSLNPKHPLMS